MKRFLLISLLNLFVSLNVTYADKLYNAQTFTLKNGLTVYLIENHRTPVVSHMVVYRVGSADDPRGKAGLAHFLEHMMFKGPKGSDPERLMGDAQKVGGSVNASTNFDVTSYYEIVPKEHLEHFMKLEASRMRALPARLEDATPEIKVVLEEENMRMGNNPFMQFYAAIRSAYFRHHPYGTMPIGYRSEIKTYTPQDVQEFHNRFYAPDNAFIILSGDMTIEEAHFLVEKHYGDIPAAKKPARKRVQEPVLDSLIQVTRTSDRVTNPYVVMMMPAPTYESKDPTVSDALDLAVYGLSNGATGVLYRRLVEELKVATSFSISYDAYELDESALMIVAHAVPGLSHLELEKIIRAEMATVLEKGFTKTQLEKFKTQTLSGLDYMKDSLLAGANQLVAPLIKGVPLEQIETWPETVKKIKLEDVNKAMKTYLQPEHYVLGYLLPKEIKVKKPQEESLPKKSPKEPSPEKSPPKKSQKKETKNA